MSRNGFRNVADIPFDERMKMVRRVLDGANPDRVGKAHNLSGIVLKNMVIRHIQNGDDGVRSYSSNPGSKPHYSESERALILDRYKAVVEARGRLAEAIKAVGCGPTYPYKLWKSHTG